jgi:hypothetical protein
VGTVIFGRSSRKSVVPKAMQASAARWSDCWHIAGAALLLGDLQPAVDGEELGDELVEEAVAVGAQARGHALGTVSLWGVYGGAASPMPLLTMFDKQIQLRMGQANVHRWVPDILPLHRPVRTWTWAPTTSRRGRPGRGSRGGGAVAGPGLRRTPGPRRAAVQRDRQRPGPLTRMGSGSRVRPGAAVVFGPAPRT